MLEPAYLGLLSVLLDRVRRRCSNLAALDLGAFGGYSVVLAGDFAQLQPVGRSLLSDGLQGTARLGRRLFESFDKVVKLRRVYRQKCKGVFDAAYRDSTLRLRDAAPRAEDHALCP